MNDRQMALYYAACATLWEPLTIDVSISDGEVSGGEDLPDLVSPEGYGKADALGRWLLDELFESDDKYPAKEEKTIRHALDVERLGDRIFLDWTPIILAASKDILSRSHLPYDDILRYVLDRSLDGIVQEARKIFEGPKSKGSLTYFTKGNPYLDELALWLQDESTLFETQHDLSATEKQKVESAVQHVINDWRALTAAAAQSIVEQTE
jgi:hypothetical protein